MRVHNYEKLQVWQKSMDFVVEIYRLTNRFPKSETYGLTSQMRRAAVSIPSNIAEGSRRSTKKDFSHFLIQAMSSGAELETQIAICKRLAYGKPDHYVHLSQLLGEIMRMLNKLIESNRG